MKLKFQIRDLLWLMIVVACCTLWWRDRVELDGYRHPNNTASDARIGQALSQKFADGGKSGVLKGFKLEVQVDNGTVWLSGYVASAAQQSSVLDMARNEKGVKVVMNEI